MNNCSQCGSSIPEGQSICSMCMGDINHGSDGYYQKWAEEQERLYNEQMEAEHEAYLQAQYEADMAAQAEAKAKYREGGR